MNIGCLTVEEARRTVAWGFKTGLLAIADGRGQRGLADVLRHPGREMPHWRGLSVHLRLNRPCHGPLFGRARL
jgi:hypothetical protein